MDVLPIPFDFCVALLGDDGEVKIMLTHSDSAPGTERLFTCAPSTAEVLMKQLGSALEIEGTWLNDVGDGP